VLTPDNQDEVLAAAKHKSRREIEELVASLRPRPDVPDRVRAVRSDGRRTGTGSSAQPDGACVAPALPLLQAESAEHDPVTSESASTATSTMNTGFRDSINASRLVPGRVVQPTSTVVPLAPERYKIQFTASVATRDKLRRAQELLRHRVPSGDLAQVVDMALECLLRDLERTRAAVMDRPRREVERVAKEGVTRRAAATTRAISRHIPAAVRREVWQRDGGRCTFVGASGIRCSERGWIEFDHRWPHGDGGEAIADNVRLLCRSHNQYEARNFFGVWQEAVAFDATDSS
jgi:5-methylcytosine-specific restriction endonuclease McrA